jgi:putative transposase
MLNRQVQRGYKFKLKVRSKALQQKLIHFSGCYRLIYNLALQQRIWLWNQRKVSLSYATQCLELPGLKEEFPFLREVHSQVFQQALLDLDRAFRGYFEGRAEFPRFKKRKDGISFRYPQGVKVEGRRVYLPKIGWIRFFKSREIEGKIKQATVSKAIDGWFISFSVERDIDIAPIILDNLIGIDMGVRRFLSTSLGWQVGNPLYLDRNLKRLVREQRRLSRKKRFSRNWFKQLRKVRMVHKKISNSRNDFLHKVSTFIAKSHGVVVEDLRVKEMSGSRTSTLNRSILDSSWGRFLEFLEYKCAERGHLFLRVSPKHTSQTCSKCGFSSSDNRRSVGLFVCGNCGLREDADINAARVILKRGLVTLRGSTVGHTGSKASGVWTLVQTMKEESHVL